MRNPSNFTNELYQIMTKMTVHFNEFMFILFQFVRWRGASVSDRREGHDTGAVPSGQAQLPHVQGSFAASVPASSHWSETRWQLECTRQFILQLLLEGLQVLSLSLSLSIRVVFRRKSKNDAHISLCLFIYSIQITFLFLSHLETGF